MSRISLRARLILAVIALAAIGLIVADIVTYSSLRSFEISRTDDSLDAAHIAVEGPLFGAPRRDGPPVGVISGVVDPLATGKRPPLAVLTAAARGDYVALLRLDGTKIVGGSTPQFRGATTLPAPALPKDMHLPTASVGRDRVRYFTTGAVYGGTHYRVRASIEAGAANHILVVAEPLSAVDSTLHRLLLIELFVTGGVLLTVGALGLWVVRIGLRPLDGIEHTAAAIAGGDLSQRIEHATPRTEIGRLGLALNAMLANIESSATERDRSLTALEASESKLRRFVADASHELRTPLAAVRAYAELFKRGAEDRPDDLARSMAGISRESERMSLLVEDLLLLAHLDEGRPIEQVRVALEDVVGEAAETARTIEPNRPIALELEPAVVLGDTHRLRQVIDNLLSNVRAHTPPDSPLRISMRRVGGFAELAVADSGPGLDAEQLAHVFERFYRADASRTRASGGAGLGLAIVAEVVGAHGGDVGAESVPGGGATFVVRLPLADD